MKIFFSAEADASIADEFLWINKEIEKPLEDSIKEKDYGLKIKKIGLIPIILPISYFAMFPDYKERKYINHKDGEADYRLYIDYEKFVKANKSEKTKMLINSFIDAIRDIGLKINDKEGFDSERLEFDIRNLFNKELL